MSEVIGVVGLGYVGLPLAVEFGKVLDTVGYDISPAKVESYRRHADPTGEVSNDDFKAAARLHCTTDPAELARANIVIVAVPTPVNDARLPDFQPLLSACTAVGPYLKQGATVVFESTVYPGATEEVCIPELERRSGKKWMRDFWVGYSPERINPGDRERTLRKIVKIVAGDTPATLERLAAAYGLVVDAGIYKASSIKVAEAAKVIENTQRDINIAFMNELAIIFNKMGLDTREVLDAAGTKWNFLKFTPGLVGGHCIGVDPYYLTFQAEKYGHHPEVILSGRRINDGMGKFIGEQTVKTMIRTRGSLNGAVVNVLGLTFKENCPDLRNSKVVDIIAELKEFGLAVNVHDPHATDAEAHEHYGLRLTAWEKLPKADAIVVAVAHREYLAMPVEQLSAALVPGGCVIDVKAVLPRERLAARGHPVWRL
jgi:UDP-N-acetyl-D-galactosamine dehydrogenase